MAAQRRRAAAAAATPQIVSLTDGEEEWGSEVEPVEEEPSLHRKTAHGTRLDESMEKQATVKGYATTAQAKKTKGSVAAASTLEGETDQKNLKKVSTKSLSKKEQVLAVTGLNAEFPTLGMTLSGDAVFNMSWVKWKQLVWMARARNALEAEGRRYKRHPRWLAMMFSRETAALWGHLGGAVKTLQSPLMK